MDLRRPLRSSSGGVEPKIRQIGFFTQTPPLRAPPSRGRGPGAVNEAGGDSGVAAGAGRPPLHHADHLPPGLPSPAMIDAVLTTSAPVRSSVRLPSQVTRPMHKERRWIFHWIKLSQNAHPFNDRTEAAVLSLLCSSHTTTQARKQHSPFTMQPSRATLTGCSIGNNSNEMLTVGTAMHGENKRNTCDGNHGT